MRPPAARWLAILALAAAGAVPSSAREPRPVGAPAPEAPTARDLVRFVRHSLEDARSLRREGRLAEAEAVARRGLEQVRDAALHRELARILDARGEVEAAARERAAADALAPPPAMLPGAPLDLDSRGALVVLVPPAAGAELPPGGWQDGPVAAALDARLELRLPEARRVHADFETTAAARAWLDQRGAAVAVSLRPERVWCGDTVKDGRFGVALLRVAVERPAATAAEPARVRAVVEEPRDPHGCVHEVVARALEQALALPELAAALAPPRPAGGFGRASARALFPGLGERIEAQIQAADTLLGLGRLADAAAALDQAAAVDAEDPVVRSYRHEVAAALALARELAGPHDDPGRVDPRLSPARRRALEAQVAEEAQRRRELLATLAVLEEAARPPPPALLAALRPVSIPSDQAFGPSLARRRAGGAVEARAAHAPDGSELARYYFPSGEIHPVLREEDSDRDGRPDRWIAYAGDVRSEIWQGDRGLGRPDVKLVFGEDGVRLARVEVDRDADDRPERILHYTRGTPSSEARDTDGDGTLDTFDRLSPEGAVLVREQDVDGDGAIDLREVWNRGGETPD
jgi:hypothetical protein